MDHLGAVALVVLAVSAVTADDTSVVAKVPAQVLRGGNATLRCSYDVGQRDLYSLKWYKGTHEFYSYVPNANEKVRVSPWAAFSIHTDPNEIGTVGLSAVSVEAEGHYKCEVSCEGPNFFTDFDKAYMAVHDVNSPAGVCLSGPAEGGGGGVATPPTPPLVAGDVVRFRCSFEKSRPHAVLSWRVDDVEVTSGVESRFRELLEPGWWSVDADLTLTVTPTQASRGSLRVNCTATVSDVYQSTSTLIFPPTLSSATKTRPPWGSSASKSATSAASIASSRRESGASQPVTAGLRAWTASLVALWIRRLWR